MAINTNPTPFTYRAGRLPPAGDDAALIAYLARENRQLERVIDGLLDFVPRDARSAPLNPMSGMVRRAVAPWRPVAGQDNDAWVAFDGTNWVPFV